MLGSGVETVFGLIEYVMSTAETPKGMHRAWH
jgi:hypothetical protein